MLIVHVKIIAPINRVVMAVNVLDYVQHIIADVNRPIMELNAINVKFSV